MSQVLSATGSSHPEVAPTHDGLSVIPHFIVGEPRGGTSNCWGTVFNPALGVPVAAVPFADADEVDRAVAAAGTAQSAWGVVSISYRTEVSVAFRHLLDVHREELAEPVTTEHGKVRSVATGEVARAIENVEFACDLVQLLRGGHSLDASGGVDLHELRQPLGVVSGITFFSLPVMVPLWGVTNAVACGNPSC